MNFTAAYNRTYDNRFNDRSYIGLIESVEDDRFIGRCKVRIFGVFGHKDSNDDSIPTDHLPYAYPLNPISFGSDGSASFSSPRLGSIVRIKFDGDIYHPVYESLEEVESGLNNLASSDYPGFHSILHDNDADLRIYYSDGSGLIIDNKGSIINIGNDNAITITHVNSESVIEIRGGNVDIVTDDTISESSNNQILKNSNYIHVNGVRVDVGGNPVFNAVLYQPLLALIKQMAAIIDQKLPLTPGVSTGLVETMQDLFKSDSIQLTK